MVRYRVHGSVRCAGFHSMPVSIATSLPFIRVGMLAALKLSVVEPHDNVVEFQFEQALVEQWQIKPGTRAQHVGIDGVVAQRFEHCRLAGVEPCRLYFSVKDRKSTRLNSSH